MVADANNSRILARYLPTARLGTPMPFEKTVRSAMGFLIIVIFLFALGTRWRTGLPKVPAATKIDVDETGKITGLF